jgi:Uncharacterized alpha/beta hydrolase domain (DUF2235)
MTTDTNGQNQCWTTATELASCVQPPAASLKKLTFDEMLARARSVSEREYSTDTPCQQQLTISFFFDGTGNNKDIDTPLKKSSNVSRLWEAHQDDSPTTIIPVYIPGVGTPFPEIGDKGGNMGMAFGTGGGGRLDYAMQRFDKELTKAEARAKNPTNKIKGIHIAIFGFSRGAAEARAFAIRLHQRLQGRGNNWVLAGKNYPVRVYFMGLFDTVASVGMSNAARRSDRIKIGTVVGVGAATLVNPGLGAIVGGVLVRMDNEGHNDWASELRIPPSVQKCVHYVAAHEVRQSFPLDTVRVASEDNRRSAFYPAQCSEVVYPGVHSNVGGGYELGEQGRSDKHDAQLSQVPLLNMFREAVKAGVPMTPMHKMKPEVRDLFAQSPALLERYSKYIAAAKPSGAVEQQAAQHLYWLYRWRKLRAGKGVDPYQVRMQRAQAEDHRELMEARRRMSDEQRRKLSPQSQADAMTHFPSQQQRQSEIDAIEKKIAETKALSDQMTLEDQRFLDKMWDVYVAYKHNKPLTLHEQKLLAAYQEPLLNDSAIIDFFDEHVHDSVAGFRVTGAGYIDTSTAGDARDTFQGRSPWDSETKRKAG